MPRNADLIKRLLIKLIWYNMIDDETLTASKAAKQVGFRSGVSGGYWVDRFNEAGL